MSEVLRSTTVIKVVQNSKGLRAGFNRLRLSDIECAMSLMVSDDADNRVECDDAVFVGDDAFVIHATDNGLYYSRPVHNDPTESEDVRDERIANIKHALDAGVIPTIGIVPTCYYGSYFASFEAALNASLEWLVLDPNLLPKCYSPPVQKYR